MITVKRLSSDEWKRLAKDAHLICFNEDRPSYKDRIDYAMLAVSANDVPMGYITVRELDDEMAYWQFGGVFPSVKDTALSYRTYAAGVDYARTRHKRILTYIENKNVVMLKFAMKAGFRIIGTKNFKGKILVEHMLEFE